MQRSSRTYAFLGWLAFGGPLLLFGAWLTPGVSFWDAGEMQTVPYILGIAHPTGFPVFVLLGWIASHAIPFGTVAWRISLLCAVAAAGAAWLVFVTVTDLCGVALAALAAAWLFASGDAVWTRGSHADVHDVALFFGAAALAASLRAAKEHSARSAVAGAIALGLGVATHPIVLFAAPCVAFELRHFVRGAKPFAATRLALLALAPLLLYLYLPVRSAQIEARGLDPAVKLGVRGGSFWDYGAPSSPRTFVAYLTGADFAPGAALLASFTPAGFPRAAMGFARGLYREYSTPAIAFAITGYVVLVTSEPWFAAGIALLVAGDAFFIGNYQPESDTLRYSLLPFWTVAVSAGVGAGGLAEALLAARGASSARIAPYVAAIGLLATIVPSARAAYEDMQFRYLADDARSLGPAIVASTPADAILVAEWSYAAPIAYDAYVERSLGQRIVLSGWPADYADRYAAWRKARRGRIYVVVDDHLDISGIATQVFANPRYQIAELRP